MMPKMWNIRVCAEWGRASNIQKSKTILWVCVRLLGSYSYSKCSLSYCGIFFHNNNKNWASYIQSNELCETLSQKSQPARNRGPTHGGGVWGRGTDGWDQWMGSHGSGTKAISTSLRLLPGRPALRVQTCGSEHRAGTQSLGDIYQVQESLSLASLILI